MWEKKSHTDRKPCFFRGFFDAATDRDTYVCFEGFDHGYIWINGFNLGRYDGAAGPQLTLYLPCHMLKEEGNEIVILDVHPVGERRRIEFLDREILEGDSNELC